jgi:DNA-binding MarR family transcriptional regulator
MDETTTRPVGWWVKEADAALEAAFDAALAGDDVDRRGWQILASLARGPESPADLKASLASFDSSSALAAALHHLRSRGWVTETQGLLHLTDEGAAQHEQLSGKVDAVRRAVATALPAEDYQQLVTLLARLVAGLGRAG